MRVLLVHNRYLQPGGEDAVFAAEQALLAAAGHEVRCYVRDNAELADLPRWRAGVESLWSRRTHAELRALMRDWRPDVMHVHNSFQRISGSACWAAAELGVPLVQTLHNFRLACLKATFFRDGADCRDCLGHAPWRGVVRGCYRASRMQSLVMAAGLQLHRGLGTHTRLVHRFVALSAYARQQFIAAGLPAARVTVKPNSAPDLLAARGGVRAPGRGGLFIGRLSEEKGAGVLAQALRGSGVLMQVAGEGPFAAALAAAGAEMLGWCGPDALADALARASFLVLPSLGAEQFPHVLAQAYAAGVPVLAASGGSLDELVLDGRTGRRYPARDVTALQALLRWADAHGPALAEMGQQAHAYYRQHLSPAQNLRALERIYAEAIEEAARAGR